MKFWEKSANNNLSRLQVQRNNKCNEHDIVSYIKDLIDLKESDSLLDVCCGNGLITKELSLYCFQVTGVDFSKKMIYNANKECNYSNIKYIQEDALTLSNSVNKKFDKIILYFSFQYFNKKQGENVLSEMKKLLNSDGKILIGDIPNKKYYWSYYDTFIKRFYCFKQYFLKQPQMGRFWSEKEMMKIAKKQGLKGTFIEQPKHLPHSHYRFDYLLENDSDFKNLNNSPL